MQVINGKDVIVAIDDVPIFCGKDCTFAEEKELIKASTVTSGTWKEYRPRKRSWSCNVSGLTKVDSTDGQLSYFDLTGSQSMELQAVSISFTDTDGNEQLIEGNAYMQSSSIDGTANQFANGSVTFIGDGLYTVNLTTS